MMTSDTIVQAFVSNAFQCFVLCCILIKNRNSIRLYKDSIYLGVASNGMASLFYIMPQFVTEAVWINNIGDSLFLVGVLVSYFVRHQAQRRERIAFIILFAVFLMSVVSGLFYYYRDRYWESWFGKRAVSQVDSLSDNVGDLKTAMADSSTLRSNQILTNRAILYEIKAGVERIEQKLNRPKLKRPPSRPVVPVNALPSAYPRLLPSEGNFNQGLDPERVKFKKKLHP